MAEKPPSIVYNFLHNLGLDVYFEKFEEMGVVQIDDMKVEHDALVQDIGMTPQEAQTLLDSLENKIHWNKKKLDIHYKLFTTLNPPERCTPPLDTTKLYYFDLINTICQLEIGELGGDLTIELYSYEGYPLACKPVNYIRKLSEWRLDMLDKPFIYAIPRWKIYSDYQRKIDKTDHLGGGTDIVQVKESNTQFEIKFQTNCSKATYFEFINEIQNIIGIPLHLYQLKNEGTLLHTNNDVTLTKLGVNHETELELIIQEEFWTLDIENNFNHNIYTPTWSYYQGMYGASFFYSCIFSVSNWMSLPEQKHANMRLKTLGHIRSLSGCSPLIHSLNIIFSNEAITLPHTVAITEILFKLFEIMKPKVSKQNPQREYKDIIVTEYSNLFWAFFLEESRDFHSKTERYVDFDFVCSVSHTKMNDPVEITDPNDVPHIVDRLSITETDEKITTLLPDFKRMVTSFNTLSGLVWESIELNSYTEDLTLHWAKLKKIVQSYFPLIIFYPLEIKNRACPTNIMIPLSKDKIGIFRTRTKLNYQIVYLDFIEGAPGISYIDDLDIKFKRDPPPGMLSDPGVIDTKTKKKNLKVLTREPEEIILVLLDTSASMQQTYFDDKSKFTSVIEAFTTFSDRSSAYNFKHVIGLLCIRHSPKLQFPLSENFIEFSDQFTDFSADGRTSIYDAIQYAINCLNTFTEKNPNSKFAMRRILCLTDGEDNRSRIQPKEVVALLIKNRIIMDTVLLCENKVYSHTIAKASGGYSFQPKCTRELMQIFEQEPMLTMKLRKNLNPLITLDKCEKFNLDSLVIGFDTELEHITPKRLKNTAIIPELYLTKAFMQKQMGQTVNKKIAKRIFQELAHYQKNPHPNFEIYPLEEEIDFWHILIDGPDDTPYSNGVFQLYIEFPLDYPDLPPHIRFVTPIYHCNINSAGRICHSIIDRSYTKGVRVREIFDQLFGLLMCPDDSDPLDSVKASELNDDPYAYFENARNYTEKNADKHLKLDLKQNILGNSSKEAIGKLGHLMCPLTQKLFEDPVLTIYGQTYEKEAILEHLKTSQYDPFSFQKLREEQLMVNLAVKSMVAQMRDELEEFGKLTN